MVVTILNGGYKVTLEADSVEQAKEVVREIGIYVYHTISEIESLYSKYNLKIEATHLVPWFEAMPEGIELPMMKH